MNDWLTSLCELNRRGEAAVLATVVKTRGSTPREPGAKMTVGEKDIRDTIGGGQLEHAAIEGARLLLEQGGDGYVSTVERHALSPALGQCCGGVVWILLERIPGRPQSWLEAVMNARRGGETVLMATRIGEGGGKRILTDPGTLSGAEQSAVRVLAGRSRETSKPVYDGRAGWFIDPVPPMDFHVMLFGAGHVGKALAGILSTLPCSLTWVDSRSGQFPEQPDPAVRIETARVPESLVDEGPPGAFYLVMTHSHPLDFAICERILERGDFAYCGVIGSRSKRRALEKRLRGKGITESMLDRLTCPIGVEGISGKRPAEIAVAVAAQILMFRGSTHGQQRPETASGG